MNVLVTGNGTSGSWAIRGVQLGEAIGATVMPRALDVAPYDLAVVVKRAPADVLVRLQRAQVPIVWDVVDAWPQPEGNRWSRETCIGWLRGQMGKFRPVGIVAATLAMAEDCMEFGVPVLALAHHARPGLQRNPIRETVRTVGYEGAEQYISNWRPFIESECQRRGWAFVVNPENLADLDIVVALRDADGYAPRHWKSNVKLANAQGSATPFVGCREAGYQERAIGNAEKWADTPQEMRAAFDALTPQSERRRASNWMLAVAPTLEQVAARYSEWLQCFRPAQSC